MTDKPEPQGSPFYLDTDGVWKLREPQGEGLPIIGQDLLSNDLRISHFHEIGASELAERLYDLGYRKLPAPSTGEYQKLRKGVVDRLNSWHLSGRQATGQLGEVADSVLALLGEEK